MARPHILLDLDSSIVSSIALTDEAIAANGGSETKPSAEALSKLDAMFPRHHILLGGSYKTYERPHLQEFLDKLSETCQVSVFTAASKPYAAAIIEACILIKPTRKLQFVFWGSHGNLSAKLYQNNHKNLRLLSETFGLKTEFERALLLDDTQAWAQDQENKVVLLKPFTLSASDIPTSEKLAGDTELEEMRADL
jgi:NLI interacting factor-like phosphatase